MNTLLAICFKVAALLLILTNGLLGVMRALPYDRSREDEIRAFLFPLGCEPPCVMGMSPGVTTWPQAQAVVDTFRARGWLVRQVSTDVAPAAYGSTEMTWNWTAEHSRLDRPSQDPLRLSFRNTVVFQNGVVALVAVSTSVSYGELWLTRGAPSDLLLSERSQSLIALYGTLQAQYIISGVSCAPYQHALFDWPTVITTRSEPLTTSVLERSVSRSDVVRWLRTLDESVNVCL
jgi:hypothetical protein